LQQEDGVIERMKLMKDLKFASKDIITSLRETIWALKKDSYTAEECLLRIKNFVQALSRYYPHIHFKVEGRAPIEALHYTKALNVVRILQEAVTNAIKHAASKNVVIRSIEKEGKWELTVEDDGKGYNTVVSDSAVNGNGLHNMKYRAKDSAIDFSINSFEGSGTIVRLVV
jgi:signal transduction histidine kinase